MARKKHNQFVPFLLPPNLLVLAGGMQYRVEQETYLRNTDLSECLQLLKN